MPSPLHDVWQLVAALLGEPVAAPESFDVALLAEVTRVHRLDAALADPALTAPAILARIPPSVLELWREARSAALARAVWRSEPVRRVFQELSPLPAIVLKGAAYAELLYPSPADRSLGDVDVLVRPSDLDDALARLERLGFRRLHPGDPSLDAPDNHERQLESAELDLDLHQGFTQQARLAIDYGAVFERSLAWPSLAPNARLLAPEDAIAYHCVHAAAAELVPDWAPAISLLDLRRMLGVEGPFWGSAGGPRLDLAAALRRGQQWGAERMLYATLRLASRAFPSLTFAAEAAARPLSQAVRVALDGAVVGRAFPPPVASPVRLEVLLRKALLLRPAAALRLLRYRLPQVLARGRAPG